MVTQMTQLPGDPGPGSISAEVAAFCQAHTIFQGGILSGLQLLGLFENGLELALQLFKKRLVFSGVFCVGQNVILFVFSMLTRPSSSMSIVVTKE